MRGPLTVLALVTTLLAASPLAAQGQRPLRLTRFSAGLDGAVAQPVGAFADEIHAAGGGTVFLAYHITPALSLRTEGTFLVYGHERGPDVCAAGSCRVEFELTTDNQIFSAFVGPQLELPDGPVRPYVGGGIGLGYFFTSSHISGLNSGEFATTTNYDDQVFAWTAGGGVRVPFRIREVPLAMAFGARYQRNGDVSYLREGSGITDNPDGSITLNPTYGPANFVLWHLGVSLTIPRGR